MTILALRTLKAAGCTHFCRKPIDIEKIKDCTGTNIKAITDDDKRIDENKINTSGTAHWKGLLKNDYENYQDDLLECMGKGKRI